MFGATTTSQTCYYQGVSDTLDVDQTIAGTVSMVIGKCGETSTGGDAHLAFALRVMQGDTSTERGLLFLQHAVATEFALIASAATRIFSALALTSVNALAGDRIVIELGIHGVTPVNEVMQIRVGDPTATADFALTSGLTTDLVSWVELSQTVTFGAPAAGGQPIHQRTGGIPGMTPGPATDWRSWLQVPALPWRRGLLVPVGLAA